MKKLSEAQKKVAQCQKLLDVKNATLRSFEKDFQGRSAEYFEGSEGKYRFAQYKTLNDECENLLEKLNAKTQARDTIEAQCKAIHLKAHGQKEVVEGLKQFKASFEAAIAKYTSKDSESEIQQGEAEIKALLKKLADFYKEYDAVFVKRPALRVEVGQLMNQVVKYKPLDSLYDLFDLSHPSEKVKQPKSKLEFQPTLPAKNPVKSKAAEAKTAYPAQISEGFDRVSDTLNDLEVSLKNNLQYKKEFLERQRKLINEKQVDVEKLTNGIGKRQAKIKELKAEIAENNKLAQQDLELEIQLFEDAKRSVVEDYKKLGSKVITDPQEKKAVEQQKKDLNTEYSKLSNLIKEVNQKLQAQKQAIADVKELSNGIHVLKSEIKKRAKQIEALKQELKEIGAKTLEVSQKYTKEIASLRKNVRAYQEKYDLIEKARVDADIEALELDPHSVDDLELDQNHLDNLEDKELVWKMQQNKIDSLEEIEALELKPDHFFDIEDVEDVKL